MAERRFAPSEVNRLIPELEGIIRTLRSIENELQEKEWRLKQAKVEARRAGQLMDDTFLKEETELEFLRIISQSQFSRVRELGGEVKGGYLVDFPGRIRGEDVLLCWKPGEKAVTWYHGLFDSASAVKLK